MGGMFGDDSSSDEDSDSDWSISNDIFVLTIKLKPFWINLLFLFYYQ